MANTKKIKCKGCNTSKRADYFQKDSKMCNVRSKRKAKTVLNAPTSNLLTTGAVKFAGNWCAQLAPSEAINWT